MMHRVEHVVMIVPVNRDEHEAQDIGQKDGHDGRQRSGLHAVRHLHLENHDRDDDRDDAVGEGFEASLAHTCDTTYFRRYRVADRESAPVCPRCSSTSALAVSLVPPMIAADMMVPGDHLAVDR